MKTGLIVFLITTVVGKNAAHFARKLQTLIGGLLLSSVAYTQMIEPGILVDPSFETPTISEVNDGLTLGETLRVVLGILLVWASRLMSFMRARNLDAVANWVGLLIGRSLPSLFRSAMTLLASWLGTLGFHGYSVEGLPDTPLATILAGLITFLVAGFSSYAQDGKFNPKDTSPPRNNIFS